MKMKAVIVNLLKHIKQKDTINKTWNDMSWHFPCATDPLTTNDDLVVLDYTAEPASQTTTVISQ